MSHLLDKCIWTDLKNDEQINQVIKDFDLSIATVVFMNDVCFSKELRDSIYEKIPRGCHFITSIERPECKILKEEILLNISWNKNKVKFYYYIK